jgi:hypothetical protein
VSTEAPRQDEIASTGFALAEPEMETRDALFRARRGDGMFVGEMGRATVHTRGLLAARDANPRETSREPVGFTTASHEDLFTERTERRCDACNAPLKRSSSEQGTGVYVWARGDEIRREEAPLCETCSTAIFAHVLEWEFDDEE